jgi:O-methyltransferase involved in polyketide biosynthesis
VVPDDSRPASHFGTAYWIAAARARESERVDRLPDDPYTTVLAGTRGRAAVDRLDQVVLFGAALDTRAFRLALPAQLSWFEIDWAELLEVALRIRAESR